ncbi:serine/threonine protein kinase [Pseudozyma hubeiensis SY62]|uniref:Serine/threonine protein kinase n=1 Tax=Pseudozyma hubeiensis (strain SY62) TaxID=1305764 RepID=R9P4C2_PSEHS|nr:serine/threonine protein kinase [Pseudozyma hubeiensis SY62]GAC96102.1 serine/threonine protein kinase [Pseudozyma hubeiensis SY62]
MSGRERNAQAGPSALRHPPQNPTSSSWTMSLFGGRQAKSTSNNLGWGLPTASSASSARNREERESLIGQPSGDDFDDSDAISLLSNIADRDSSRGGSAAARRRARARSRAQGRTCGTFWFDVEDWSRSLSCGLLGRGQRGDGAGPARQRAASIGSVMSRGARRNNAPSSEEQVVATSRHSRSHSNASTDSAGSLAGSGFAEIDADAGMLDDRDIARFGTQPSPTEESETEAEAEAARAKATAEEAQARAEAEAADVLAAAERQKALEAESARLQAEAEAESQRQKEEEVRLAAEEEAAIAKARRRAQRKAAKAGLLQLQQETQGAQRWRTEAEAEAAAGGFAFADAEGDESYEGGAQQQQQQQEQQQFQYHDAEYGLEEEHEQYGDAEEASGYYAGTVQEQGPGGVVHHHHYYHSAPPVVEEEEFHYPAPEPQVHDADAFTEDRPEPATTDKVSEDEADIAGLSFGRKKSRRNQSGSAGSRSGSGLRPAHTTGGSSSGGSASGLPPAISASSSSSSSRAPYRDRPRRHERTTSKSSTSSSGIFSAVHPGAASTAATSVTSSGATPLPNLYEAQSVYPAEQGADVEHAQFGKPEVDASEFGVITAGSHRGGAGRVKKSYKDKRHQPGSQEEHEGKFEGFPGF